MARNGEGMSALEQLRADLPDMPPVIARHAIAVAEWACAQIEHFILGTQNIYPDAEARVQQSLHAVQLHQMAAATGAAHELDYYAP